MLSIILKGILIAYFITLKKLFTSPTKIWNVSLNEMVKDQNDCHWIIMRYINDTFIELEARTWRPVFGEVIWTSYNIAPTIHLNLATTHQRLRATNTINSLKCGIVTIAKYVYSLYMGRLAPLPIDTVNIIGK